MFDELFKKKNTLSFEFKRMHSTTFETTARVEVQNCCKSCDSIHSFVIGFNNAVATYSPKYLKELKEHYQARLIDSKIAHVYWIGHVKRDGKDVLIAEIKLTEND